MDTDGLFMVELYPFYLFVVHGNQCSCLQLPLKLAWTVTIHKAQGLTLNKHCVELTRRNFLPTTIFSVWPICVESHLIRGKSHCTSQKQLFHSIISAFINLASLSSVVSICLLNLLHSLLFLSLSSLVAMLH